MPQVSVTLGTGPTPIFTSGNVPAWANPTRNYATVQNNSAHVCAVGGPDVTLNTGILLSAGSPGVSGGGSYTMTGEVFLTQKYIIGTQNDVITVEYE